VAPPVTEEKEDNEVEEVEPPMQEMQQDFHDTNLLPFPRRNRKAKTDEQSSKFVKVIQKLYINIPLLDAIKIPTYARYLRDILNNKGLLPTTEVIKLTKECSVAILNTSIDCSIGDQHFNNVLCDLGATVSVMPKTVFDKLHHSRLMPTSMCL
jgi:hypothetical protein